MLPMEEAEVFNDDAEDDMMHTIRTGQIPDQLLQDILEEAGQFMDLFNHNPSSFLRRLAKLKSINPKPSNFSEKLMTKRKGLIKKNKKDVFIKHLNLKVMIQPQLEAAVGYMMKLIY